MRLIGADERGQRVFVVAANGGTPALLKIVGPTVIEAYCS
jgi:hypothetical protein